MSIISEIKTGFRDIEAEVDKITGSSKTKAIAEKAAQIFSLIAIAEPLAQQVADAVFPLDAPLIAAAGVLLLKINTGVQTWSNAEKLAVVSKATQIKVAATVAAGSPVPFGSTMLTTQAQVDAIPQNTLDTAAQVSYSLGVKTTAA